jgi:hypothetical protein
VSSPCAMSAATAASAVVMRAAKFEPVWFTCGDPREISIRKAARLVQIGRDVSSGSFALGRHRRLRAGVP